METLINPFLSGSLGELAWLYSEMLELERSLLKRPLELHKAHRRSARNLAHYLALRRHDVRQLQSQLALLGLSSLGRTESHVLTAVQTVHRVLDILLGSKRPSPCPEVPSIEDNPLTVAFKEKTSMTPSIMRCRASARGGILCLNVE
jgi:pyruvate kinase